MRRVSRVAAGRLALAAVLALAAGACRKTTVTESSPTSSAPVERSVSALTALTRTGWVLSTCTTAATCGGTLANATDGNASTAWTTAKVQTSVQPFDGANTQFFKVDMLASQSFVGVGLDAGTNVNNFPHSYKVEVSTDNATWTSVATGTGTTPLVNVAFGTQTARYLRVSITATTTVPWSIAELNVYATALPRTGWVLSSNPTGTGSANAIDGSSTTKWSSGANQANGQYFQIDMLDLKSINKITLDAGTSTGEYPRSFQVLVSKDGQSSTFTNVAATGTGTSQLVTISFASVEARYIRIALTGAATNFWSIYELNVFGSSTPATALPRVGWATAPGTTSSPDPGGNGSVRANALDGSTGSRWTSGAGQATSQFFQVDMLAPQSFTQVTLDSAGSTNDYPRGYQVFVSNDASTWTSVATGTGTAALVTATFSLQNARYVKVQLTQAFAANWWSIAEFNVYGPAVTRNGWVATSSTALSGTNYQSNAIDGSATTRWTTGANQANGQTFQLDMAVPETFTGLTVDAGTSTGQYPRGYQVFVSSDGTNWGSAIATGTGTTELLVINFPIQTARYLKIVQTGTATTPWAIQELNLWRACGAGTCVTDQCHTVACDPVLLVCPTPTNKTNGTTCDDASACTTGETCQNGSCTNGTAVTCTTDQCHTVGACVPATGCPAPVAKADGASCNDGKTCTATDVCTAGVCGGTVTCPPSDQCHAAGACNASGACTNPPVPDGTPCPNSNACDGTEICQAGTCTPGVAPVLDDNNPCTIDACDPANGVTHTPGNAGTVCRQANGGCDVAEVCDGISPSCPTDTFAPATTVCRAAANQCDVAEKCTGSSAACPSDGLKPNGSSCDDGNACTANDTCQSGTCTSGSGVTCTAPDQCHDAGTCNATEAAPPQNGIVGWWRLDGDGHDSGPNHLDLENVGAQQTGGRIGGAYDFDGTSYLRLTNAPAALDLAHANGVTMMAWVRTSPLAQPTIDYSAIMGKGYDYSMAVGWHTGAPSPGLTGTLHAKDYFAWGYPGWAGGLPAGTWHHVAIIWDKSTNLFTNYIDGFGYTSNAVPGFSDTGVLSNDNHTFAIGAFMQAVGATPSGFSPNYMGSIDEAVLYDRALSPAELNGYLAAANNPCTSPTKADGTTCSDGNPCTQTDACQAGVCTGTNLVLCPTPDACHDRGTCDPTTGACGVGPTAADGTTCSDGNSCTSGETCHAGACTSGTAITCAPPGQCQQSQSGTCDPTAGVAPPSNGLIGWWRLEGNGADSSPSHDDLNVTSAPSVGGQAGGGLAFTPGKSCVNGAAPPGASLSGAPGMTLMAWVRVSKDWQCPTGAEATVVFGKGNDYNIAIKCSTNDAPALFPLVSQGGGLGWGDPPPTLFPRGEWHHLAVTWDRANVYAFVDGGAVWSWAAPADVNNLDHDVSIGCVDSNTYWVGTPFDGDVDEAVLYDRPLTPSEIRDYFQASASPGVCAYTPKPNGTSCDDNDLCTTGDSCQAGACTGAPVTCTAPDQCHAAGICEPSSGVCFNPPKGDFTPCDDGSACTRTDVCLEGACTGRDHVDCSSSNPCMAAGVCDPSTGACEAPAPRPDGTSCSDGNACTDGDTCHAGSCVAGPPPACPVGACQTATCDPNYADPPPQDQLIAWWRLEGNTLDSGPNHIDLTGSEGNVIGGKIGKALEFDGYGCYTAPAPAVSSTANDQAMTVMAWVKVPADFPCPTHVNDDRVVFAKGQDYAISVGCSANGQPVAGGVIHVNGGGYGFAQSYDVLTPDVWHLVAVEWDHGAFTVHLDGQFEGGNDFGPAAAMSNEEATIALGCNASRIWWVGEPFVGSVDEVSVLRRALSSAELQAYYGEGSAERNRCAASAAPNGSFCDDGNLCTQGDTCEAGVCTPGPMAQCHALDQCHDVGTCSVASGGCSNPLKTNGTSCNDGNACTQTDTCQAGTCTGGNPVTCADPDSCHTASCDPAGGPNYPKDGLVGLWHLDGSGADASDGANDFTVANADVVTGERGSAYVFGPGTCLSQPAVASNDLSSGTGISIAGWVNPSAACPGSWTLFQRGQQVALQLSCANGGPAGLSYAINTGPGLAFSAPFGSVPLNQWSFVAMSWDKAAQQVQLFVNGSPVKMWPQAGAISGPASTMVLGCDGTMAGGMLDEFALYDRPLDATKDLAPLAAPPTMCKSAPKCGDPDGCNTRTCDATTGTCSAPMPKADGTDCSDGQGCTQGDKCAAGVCVGGAAVTCGPASAACNESVCDTAHVDPAPPDVVAQWKFDGDLKDASPNGNDFSGGGGVSVAGKDGQAMHFAADAACAFLPVRPTNNINNPAGVTLSAWVKPDDHFCTSGASGHVLELQNAFGFRLVCRPDGTIGVSEVAYSADGYGGVFNPAGTLHEGQWSHVAVIFARWAEYMYIDGEFVEGDAYPSVNEELPRTANGFYLGCGAGATIDDAILFRRALSIPEIAALHTSPGQCTDRPKTCIAADSCHQNGTCDPGTGQCSDPPAPNGTICSTGSSCTVGQTCTAGACGGGALACAAPSGQCQQATCEETNRPTPPQNGLVGWWKFEGDTKDSSGHGLDLADSGTTHAQLTAGKIGQAMKFDGSACLASGVAVPGFDLSSSEGVTMMAWIKVTSGPWSDNWRTIMGKGSDYSMATYAQSSQSTLTNITGTVRPLGDQRLGYPGGWGINYDGSWALVAITWDHHTLQMWVNGTGGGWITIDGLGPSDGDVVFNIGCTRFFGVPDAFQFFNGIIDEATLYNRVITPEEFAKYYADSTTPVCGSAPAADGTACNDGNSCTSGDTCHLGTCYGAAMMSCPQPGPCQILAGTCDPQSGCPAPVAAPNGTACNDGNACTKTDTCQAGACVGSNAVACAPADECHGASTCDPQSGTCSTPVVTGTSDVCVGGSFDYDGAGRLVRDHATTLTYDAYDQLRVVVPGPAGGVPLSNLAVEDLGDVGDKTTSYAEGTNNAGQVLVDAPVSGLNHAFLRSGAGTVVDLSAGAGIPGASFGSSLSRSGDVLVNQALGPDDAYRPWRLRAGSATLEAMPPLPNGLGWSVGINSSGEFVGYLGTFLGARTSFRYTDAGGYEDLGGFGGVETDVWAIDDDGTIYLSSDFPDTPRQVLSDTAHFGHAAVFDPVTHQLRDLNTLIDATISPGWTLYTAYGGNATYYYGEGDLDGVHQPYRLNKATGEVLPTGSVGQGQSFADHGNSFGDIPGWGYKSAGNHYGDFAGWVYVEGRGFYDLNNVIDPASGWQIASAYQINDQGDVVGWGTLNGQQRAFRIRLPLRTSGAAGPALAEAHTYGYDGLRTSTSTGADLLHLDQSQYWFTQDYTETADGTREHYVRIGNRIVAKVTYGPAGGMPGVGLVRAPTTSTRDSADLVAQILIALLLTGGLAASVAGGVGRKRRPAWVAATAGPVILFFGASCEMLGSERRSAQSLWTRVEIVYFHNGIEAGPAVTTNSDGGLREERRYEPFGQPVDSKFGATIGPVDFRREPQNSLGKMTDPDTGWSYHGARWFAPQTARWTSPDPVVKGPDQSFLRAPWALNPYAYVLQSPTLFSDPTGLEDTSIAGQLENVATQQQESERGREMIAQSAEYFAKNSQTQQRWLETPTENKCNLGTADWIDWSGVPRPQVPYAENDKTKTQTRSERTKEGLNNAIGRTRLPTAHEWADPNVQIAGWSQPLPLSQARRGDVVAQEHNQTGPWGHVGVVVHAPQYQPPAGMAGPYIPAQVVSVSSLTKPPGLVTTTDWGFRGPGNNGEIPTDPPPVVRRYIGPDHK